MVSFYNPCTGLLQVRAKVSKITQIFEAILPIINTELDNTNYEQIEKATETSKFFKN